MSTNSNLMLVIALCFFVCTKANFVWNDAQIRNPSDYAPRTVSLALTDANKFLPLYYSSISTTSVDGLYGVVYAGGDSYSPPMAQFGIFYPYTNWAQQNPIMGDYSFSAGFMAMSFVKLEEVDSHGTVYRTINLDTTMPWTVTSVTQQEDLTYAMFTGGYSRAGVAQQQNNNNNNNNKNNQQNSALYAPVSVSLTTFVSNRTGTLQNGIVLTPKSISVFVEIMNFPYTVTGSSIRFTMAMASASSTNSSVIHEGRSFDRVVIGGDSAAPMYADFAHQAICDHGTYNVKIHFNTSAVSTDLYNYKMVNKVLYPLMNTGKFVKFHSMSVTFPPGVQNISWDPVIGAGIGPDVIDNSSISDSLTAGETAGLVIGCLLGSALLGCFVFYCVCVRSQRSKKNFHIQETSNLTYGASQTYQTLP